MSCEKHDGSTKYDEPKTFEVRLKSIGEIDVTHSPLTRFTPDERDLYAVQIWTRHITESNKDYYAYGLFDDLSNAKFDVTENYEYGIYVLLIENGKDQIYCDSLLVNDESYLGYGKPFYTNGRCTRITNEFIMSNEIYFNNLRFNSGRGMRYQRPDGTENPQNLNVYYGEGVYLAEADKTEISIYMKRMNYGLKVEIGDFFSEGILKMVDSFHNIEHTFTPDNKVFETICAAYSVDQWYQATSDVNSTCTHGLDFSWTREDGSIVDWYAVNVSCHRLMWTNLSLNYPGDNEVLGKNYLELRYEDLPIEGEYKNYTYGDNLDDITW